MTFPSCSLFPPWDLEGAPEFKRPIIQRSISPYLSPKCTHFSTTLATIAKKAVAGASSTRIMPIDPDKNHHVQINCTFNSISRLFIIGEPIGNVMLGILYSHQRHYRANCWINLNESSNKQAVWVSFPTKMLSNLFDKRPTLIDRKVICKG